MEDERDVLAAWGGKSRRSALINKRDVCAAWGGKSRCSALIAALGEKSWRIVLIFRSVGRH